MMREINGKLVTVYQRNRMLKAWRAQLAKLRKLIGRKPVHGPQQPIFDKDRFIPLFEAEGYSQLADSSKYPTVGESRHVYNKSNT